MKFLPLRCLLVLSLAGLVPASAQLVFDGLAQTPNGLVNRLFQFQNGTVSEIPTGIPNAILPSVSRDGRFISFSGVDPQRPNQASSDLFLFDRATGQTTTLINNTARTLSDQSILSLAPTYSAISPNNRLVAVHTVVATSSVNGGGAFNDLEVVPMNGQGPSYWVERSTGDLNNFYRSEFMGISWAPDGSVFATSAAIPIPVGDGRNSTLPGIVAYAFNPNVAPSGAWQRVAQLSRVSSVNFVDNFQVFPAFSPDGQRIAYFNVAATPLLTTPFVATLVLANADGSQARALTSFSPGVLPSGTTWAADGSLVIFSIGQQVSAAAGPGVLQYAPRVLPETTVVRAVDSVNGGTPFQLSNVNAGSAPSNNFAAVNSSGNTNSGGGSSVSDLSQIPVRLTRQANGGFLMFASGLDPNASYQIESSTTLNDFPNRQSFLGAEIMNGITIPKNERRKFFRIRRL